MVAAADDWPLIRVRKSAVKAGEQTESIPFFMAEPSQIRGKVPIQKLGLSHSISNRTRPRSSSAPNMSTPAGSISGSADSTHSSLSQAATQVDATNPFAGDRTDECFCLQEC
jgi:hypothetical protein